MAKKSTPLIEVDPTDGITTVETADPMTILDDDLLENDELEVVAPAIEDDPLSALDADGISEFEPDNLPDIEPASLSARGVSVASLIKNFEEDLNFLTWLVYGKNGCGKTKFLASGGEHTLIVDADAGTLTVKAEVGKKFPIKTWQDFEDLYWFLASGTPKNGGIELDLPEGKWLCKTVAIDTLTKLQNICMRTVVLKERASDATKDVVNPTLRDWGIMGQKMMYWLTAFKGLPVQKLWAVQERNNVEEVGTDGFVAAPDMSKSLRTYVQTEADIIGRMYIKQVERDGKKGVSYRMRVGGSEEFITKDRTNKLKPIIENPKFKALYELSLGQTL